MNELSIRICSAGLFGSSSLFLRRETDVLQAKSICSPIVVRAGMQNDDISVFP
jgi:hypothetical protein